MVYYGRGGGMRFFYFLISLIVGLYFINYPFKFVNIPTIPAVIENWIIFIGGVLLILGGLMSLFRPRYY